MRNDESILLTKFRAVIGSVATRTSGRRCELAVCEEFG
jgi:hypothetical protein